jgi:hypothetical protein
MSKADGYAVVLDDKGSPYGYWFVGAWNTQESAEIALKGQKGNGRIVPLYFRPEEAATTVWGPVKQEPGGQPYRVGTSTGAMLPPQPDRCPVCGWVMHDEADSSSAALHEGGKE